MREAKLYFCFKTREIVEFFESDLAIFCDESTWEWTGMSERNPRTGKGERTKGNKTLKMLTFESDYRMLRNRSLWKPRLDHAFAKLVTRLFPAIFIAIYPEIRREYKEVSSDNVYHKKHGACLLPIKKWFRKRGESVMLEVRHLQAISFIR
jgi:hypothetical protein